MIDWYWSWILTTLGVSGILFAGYRIWWAWYLNLAAQFVWFYYAIATEQYGFILAAVIYTAVFTQNAVKWTKERHLEPEEVEEVEHIHDPVTGAPLNVIERIDDPEGRFDKYELELGDSGKFITLFDAPEGEVKIDDSDIVDIRHMTLEELGQLILDEAKKRRMEINIEDLPFESHVLVRWRTQESR